LKNKKKLSLRTKSSETKGKVKVQIRREDMLRKRSKVKKQEKQKKTLENK